MENTPKSTPNINFNVEFKQNDNTVVVASGLPDLVTAVKFALSLHEASNTSHSIYVLHDAFIDVVFHRD